MGELIVHEPNNVFFKNDVINFDGSLYRVVEVMTEVVFLFELEIPSGYPVPFKRLTLIDAIFEGNLTHIDDLFLPLLEEDLSDKDKQKLEKNYAIIAPIVNHPEYLYRYKRGKLVAKAIETHGVSKASVYRHLRRYWQYGQSKNALASHYRHCGAPGKTRNFNIKPGRKSANDLKPLAVVNESIRRYMLMTFETFVLAQKQKIPYAYNRFVTACKASLNLTDDSIPSKFSFSRFCNKTAMTPELLIKKYGMRTYQKDIRALLSTSTSDTIGPGSVYQIDSTIADIMLVCEKKRAKVLGRPVIYLVIDVFSRLIVGYYIGFENASYSTAMLALLNAIRDKSDLLAKFDISPEVCATWPACGLPEQINADKGEMMSYQAENLVNNFNIDISNSPSGRSDANGVVERYFPIVQSSYKGKAGGETDNPKLKKAGGVDPVKTACLSFTEFEKVIVSLIILRNNTHVLEGYDVDEDYPTDLPTTPVNIWRWGMQNRVGGLRQVNENLLQKAILPTTKASFSRNGIKANGFRYTSAKLVELGWISRDPQSRIYPRVKAYFDPASVNQIYLYIPEISKDFITCYLKQEEHAYENLSLNEAKALKNIRKKTTVEAKQISDEALRQLEESNIEVFKNAKKETKKVKRNVSKAKKSKNENRKQALKEEQENRVKQQFEHDAEAAPQYYSNQDDGEPGDYRNPNLNQFFNNIDKEVENEPDGNETNE